MGRRLMSTYGQRQMAQRLTSAAQRLMPSAYSAPAASASAAGAMSDPPLV